MAKEPVSCYEGRGPKRGRRRPAVEPLWSLATGFLLGVQQTFAADYLVRGVSVAMGLWIIFEVGFMNGLFLT
jgi:hypothetical protein